MLRRVDGFRGKLAVCLAYALTVQTAYAGQVTIRSSPAGATVCREGEAIGKTGEEGLTLTLPNQAIPFVVYKDGHEPKPFTLVPRADADVNVRVTLEETTETFDSPCEFAASNTAGADIGEIKAHWVKGVRYLGGPGFPEIESVKKSWDNSLSLTEDYMILGFKNSVRPPVNIQLSSIERLSYGQNATRNAAKWVATGVLLAPLALFGLFHKSRKHHVLVAWTDQSGRTAGMMMQLHKKNMQAMLNAMTFYANKPLYADPDDRKWLLKNGVDAEVEPDEVQ